MYPDTVIKTDVEKLAALAEKNHWGIREVHDGDPAWRFEPLKPADIPNCTIPDWALSRLYEILKSGIPIRGLMVGHEVPLEPVEIPWKVAPMLPWVVAPEEPQTPVIEPYRPPQTGLDKNPDRTALIVAGVAAGILLTPIVLPMIAMGAALLGVLYFDPSLVIVLEEDGSWWEVGRWYSPSDASHLG